MDYTLILVFIDFYNTIDVSHVDCLELHARLSRPVDSMCSFSL